MQVHHCWLIAAALVGVSCGGKRAPKAEGGAESPEQAALTAFREDSSPEERLRVIRENERGLAAITTYVRLYHEVLPQVDALQETGVDELGKIAADIRALGRRYRLDDVPESEPARTDEVRKRAGSLSPADASTLFRESRALQRRILDVFDAHGRTIEFHAPVVASVDRTTDRAIVTLHIDGGDDVPVTVVLADGRWWVDFAAMYAQGVAQAEAEAKAHAEPDDTEDRTPTDDSFAPIGIAECDDYVAKMRACVAQADYPEKLRAENLQGVADIAEKWRARAENPGVDKKTIAELCAKASASAAEVLGADGCAF